MTLEENQVLLKSTNDKCKNCGGDLTFDPSTQDLRCPNCDSHFPFAKTQTARKHNLSEGLKLDDSNAHDKWASSMKMVKCQTCGAEIMLSGLDISTCCPYCGSNYVSESQSLPGLKPDEIIPFMFDHNSAGDLFIKGMKKKFFAPSKLKKKLPEGTIQGIYVPAFTFDADTNTTYKGRLYNDKTYTDSKGNSHTKREYFSISGTQDCYHKDVVIESSSRINDKIMRGLLPYNFDNDYDYDTNFARGYSIEHYNESLSVSFEKSKQKMEEEIKSAILRRYDYDGVDYLNLNTSYYNEKYSYRILPIYSFNIIWKKKNYMVFMNGQTGKVGNQYPKSPLKIALVVFIGIAILAGLVVLWLYGK